MNSETRNCQNCKQDFVIEPDDFGFYEKIGVPAPKLCPLCRRMRRLSWRNDYNLYPRECDLCKKKFISIYSPSHKIKIRAYCPKCFWGDNWDPYECGAEYDPSRSFIDQFISLFQTTPALGIVNDNDIGSVNCLYTQDVAFSKNCAMTFVAWRLENVFCSSYLAAGKYLCDCLGVHSECEYIYDGLMIEQDSRCKSVYWVSSCVDCNFCYDCRGCSDCFMCAGLRNKRFYFKNQQLTQEEFKKTLDSYNLRARSGYSRAKEEFKMFLRDIPRKYAELRNCSNCSGTDMIRSKNTHSANFASLSEDSKYVHNGITFKQSYDCAGAGETELAYESITPDQSYLSMATVYSWKNNNASYCSDCHSCSNVLGCVGLKKGEYSILNKKYPKGEYFNLREKIIADMKRRGEWGEFFPISSSPFGFNETRAFDQWPIGREDALSRGYNWLDNIQQTRGKQTLSQEKVPDSIDDVPDTFINEILACLSCGRNYNVLPGELALYKQLHVPIPDRCFFCRQSEREEMRGGFDFMHRRCDCAKSGHNHDKRCPNEFETFFTEKERRPIYCESCYNSEIV